MNLPPPPPWHDKHTPFNVAETALAAFNLNVPPGTAVVDTEDPHGTIFVTKKKAVPRVETPECPGVWVEGDLVVNIRRLAPLSLYPEKFLEWFNHTVPVGFPLKLIGEKVRYVVATEDAVILGGKPTLHFRDRHTSNHRELSAFHTITTSEDLVAAFKELTRAGEIVESVNEGAKVLEGEPFVSINTKSPFVQVQGGQQVSLWDIRLSADIPEPATSEDDDAAPAATEEREAWEDFDLPGTPTDSPVRIGLQIGGKRDTRQQAQEKVDQWNRTHKVGMRLRYRGQKPGPQDGPGIYQIGEAFALLREGRWLPTVPFRGASGDEDMTMIHHFLPYDLPFPSAEHYEQEDQRDVIERAKRTGTLTIRIHEGPMPEGAVAKAVAQHLHRGGVIPTPTPAQTAKIRDFNKRVPIGTPVLVRGVPDATTGAAFMSGSMAAVQTAEASRPVRIEDVEIDTERMEKGKVTAPAEDVVPFHLAMQHEAKQKGGKLWAHEVVDLWNRHYPSGTFAYEGTDPGNARPTSSIAFLMHIRHGNTLYGEQFPPGHHPVVMFEGNGMLGVPVLIQKLKVAKHQPQRQSRKQVIDRVRKAVEEIDSIFATADYWNRQNPGEKQVEADPEDNLAEHAAALKQWIAQAEAGPDNGPLPPMPVMRPDTVPPTE